MAVEVGLSFHSERMTWSTRSIRTASNGGRRWGWAKSWALAPLVLLAGLYSAFGIVFLVIPARLTTALLRGPRRLLGRLSRWVG